MRKERKKHKERQMLTFNLAGLTDRDILGTRRICFLEKKSIKRERDKKIGGRLEKERHLSRIRGYERKFNGKKDTSPLE